MELCLITPAAHVQYTSLLPGRFCLANVEDDKYRGVFVNDAANGYDVVLDNGVFEDDLIDTDKYFEVIRRIKPRVVIAPDLMNADAHVNLQHALEFVTVINDLGIARELMFVPQCRRNGINSYEKALREAIKSGCFQWIGICRNACFNAFGQNTHTKDESINKFFFGAWAENNGILQVAHAVGIRFHLLGIGGDINLLQHLWWVDRADTASLFFQATLGNRISNDGILPESVSRPTDYFRRDFGPPNVWETTLKFNCKVASAYASEAARLKHSILKDRI